MIPALDNTQYDRQQSPHYMSQLRNAFIKYFGNLGYQPKQPMRVIDAKLVDPTTRFIGSHTSVLKPYIYARTVPSNGFSIIQPCFQAQNLKLYTEKSAAIFNGSLFECHGLLTYYSQLDAAIEHVVGYFSHLGINDRILYHVNSIDSDLLCSLSTISSAKYGNIILDALPLQQTRHQFGDDRLSGRDIRIEMLSDKCAIPCAVIIVVSLDSVPSYIEVTIAAGRILQQYYGLSHYLDTFAISGLPKKEEILTRKLEDCIVSVVLLCREGLCPGGSENRRRILRKYLKFLGTSCAVLGVNRSRLEHILINYETAHYNNIIATPKIIGYLNVISQL